MRRVKVGRAGFAEISCLPPRQFLYSASSEIRGEGCSVWTTQWAEVGDAIFVPIGWRLQYLFPYP